MAALSSIPTRALQLLVPCVTLFACGDDHPSHHEPDATISTPHGDAGSLDGATVVVTHPADGGTQIPNPDGGPPIQLGDVDGGAGGDAQIAQGGAWQLDCTNLPSNGVCQGGPREVLLATTGDGDVLMLDPQDGHFLGVFKESNQNPGFTSEGYQQATQGPDQCVWTVSGDDNEATTRAVERWNTDGSFHDGIIPRGKFKSQDGSDRLLNASAIAFGADYVLVANGDYGDNNTQISRYHLDGSFDTQLAEANVDSMIVQADGSLLTAGDTVQRWPAFNTAGSTPANVYTESSNQIWNLGQGEILVGEYSDAELTRVTVASGTTSSITVGGGDDQVLGVAALGNGNWLYTSKQSIFSVDPKNPSAALGAPIFSFAMDQRKWVPTFTQFGRACLPSAVVERQPLSTPVVAADHCDDVPAGNVILSEGFETGAFSGSGTQRSFDGWSEATPYAPLAQLPTGGSYPGGGARTLQVSPKTDQEKASGVMHTFAGIKPSYIGYWVKVDTTQEGYAELLLNGYADLSQDELEGVYLGPQGVGTEETTLSISVADLSAWTRIQLRNIDWTRRRYDLYVNCVRVGTNIRLNPDVGDDIKRIDLYAGYNGTNTKPAYFDDILIK